MAGLIVGPLGKNQPMLVELGSPFKLAMCRGYSIGIFVSVLIPKQAKIQLATLDFVQIEIICPTIHCGDILKQKRFEEPSQ